MLICFSGARGVGKTTTARLLAKGTELPQERISDRHALFV